MKRQIDMLQILINEPNLEFTALKTVGEAIGAELQTEEMADQMESLAISHEWICTRRSGKTVSIESGRPKAHSMILDATLFHVSRCEHRKSILSRGLKPTTGGGTSLGRTYAPRLHLTATMRDAFQFIHHQMKPPMSSDSGLRLLDAFDIYRVAVKSGFTYFNDDHFDCRGLWITTSLPTASVTLSSSEDWHYLYQAMYPEDFQT